MFDIKTFYEKYLSSHFYFQLFSAIFVLKFNIYNKIVYLCQYHFIIIRIVFRDIWQG